jgi:hypothetical protein
VINIKDQVYKYSEAIDGSVVAAHKGFTVATDAISLCDPRETYSAQDVENHLDQMITYATACYLDVEKVHMAFRTVHVGVIKVFSWLLYRFLALIHSPSSWRMQDSRLRKSLISRANVCIFLSMHCDTYMTWIADEKITTEHRADITQLDQFAQSISSFSKYWNSILLELYALKVRTQMNQVHYSKIRFRSLFNTWNFLKNQFADYKSQVRVLLHQVCVLTTLIYR